MRLRGTEVSSRAPSSQRRNLRLPHRDQRCSPGWPCSLVPSSCFCTWDRVSDRVRAGIYIATAVAAIGGTFLAINFHLANGAAHAWLIPADAFDEGIDLDSILPAIQIVIAPVNITLFRRLREMRASGTPSTQSPL